MRWLADAIAAGTLRPGDAVPTVNELSATLGVARNRTATISGNLRSDLSQATAYDLYGNKIAYPVNGANLSLTEDPVYFVAGAAGGPSIFILH
jgi:DNA-binding transcriptional MocR family regulator